MKTKTKRKVANLIDENYHDTEKLLNIYRDVKWNLAITVTKAKKEFIGIAGVSIDEFLDSMYMAGMNVNDTKLSGITETIQQNHKMITILETAVSLLREQHKNGEIYYQILYYTYFYKTELTLYEILDKLKKYNIKKTRYYELKKEAINILSNSLWGYTKTDLLHVLENFI